MQTVASADEAQKFPFVRQNTGLSNRPDPGRRSTLSIVKLRTENKNICVNWSRVPENVSNKKLKDLIDSLEQNINECLEQPIEVLEEKLFHLCYVYYTELNGLLPSSQIIEIFHMVNVAQEECSKSTNITKALHELGKNCEDYMKTYDFLCQFVKLINDLCLIYGIINLFDYSFRFGKEVEMLKAVNMRSLFSDVINMEVIWLSYIVLIPPMKYVLSKEVKELAKLLQEEFFKTLDMFMESNKEHLDNKNFIKAWLASKNLKLVEQYGFRVEKLTVKPAFQSLTQKFFSCFLCKKGYQASDLKCQLAEFEKIYHHFEGVILKSWYDLEKSNN